MFFYAVYIQVNGLVGKELAQAQDVAEQAIKSTVGGVVIRLMGGLEKSAREVVIRGVKEQFHEPIRQFMTSQKVRAPVCFRAN